MMITNSLNIVFFYIFFLLHANVIFVLNIVNLVAVLFKGGSIIYYCDNILKPPELINWFMSVIMISSFFGTVFFGW